MLDKIRKRLAPPDFEDEEKGRIARQLNSLLLISIALLSAAGILRAVTQIGQPDMWPGVVRIVLSIILLLITRAMMLRGRVRTAAWIFSATLWTISLVTAYTSGGVRSPAFPTVTIVVVAIGLLLGWEALLAGTLLTMGAGLVLILLERNRVLAPFDLNTYQPIEIWSRRALDLVGISILLYVADRTIDRTLTRARRNERALVERTRELEASQRVTFAASERVEPDELLGLVVDLIRDQFRLYHVQVYITDPGRGVAELRESTGYAGYQLLQQNHEIPLDRPALVTKAIQQGEPVLVNDVSQAPDFMPNPLLPETTSELVVPLTSETKVIGALDIQDRTADRFNQHTVSLFQTMAEQIAFLFENSELIEDVTKQAQALQIITSNLRIAADIAEQVSNTLDLEEQLEEIVALMQSRFGLYHAHVYLVEHSTGPEDQDQLVVRAGSGEVGRILRRRGHAIALSTPQSLVARAARERQPILVNDTHQAPDFMPNPLLPQTRSEISLPLLAGEQLVGVLDLQSTQVNRFAESDVDVFSTLAGQIATAAQNALLFEEAQETTQALRRTNALKSDLIAKIDHEMRTPLNSIIGYAEMILEDGNDLSPESRQEIKSILQNGHVLQQMINELLSLSRDQESRIALTLEPVDLDPLLQQVRARTTRLLDQKPVELQVEVDDGLPTIQADRIRLSQVINDLVTHAINQTPQGHIRLRGEYDEDWVTLEIDFTPQPGSDGDEVESLFTRQVVEQHGGQLTTEKRPGAGRRITLRLPTSPPIARYALSERARRQAGAKDTP